MLNLFDAKKRAAYARLMRIDRPIGTFLLLWPTLWALWFAADGLPEIDVLAIFVAGVFVMRAAGCVINDFADRHIDGYVERTRERPLATGEVSSAEALTLFVVLLVLALGLVLLTNQLTLYLSFGGALLAAIYPFTKRYTYLPQVFLGAAFGWSVPMAYAAQAGQVTTVTWLLFIATVLWATAYDTMYAMVDRDDDLKIGVKSTAVLFGDLDRMAIGVAQLMLLLTLYLAGERAGYGMYWLSGLALGTLLGLYQQWLIRNQERQRCFRAFLNNNWLGAAVFAGLVAETLPLPDLAFG